MVKKVVCNMNKDKICTILYHKKFQNSSNDLETLENEKKELKRLLGESRLQRWDIIHSKCAILKPLAEIIFMAIFYCKRCYTLVQSWIHARSRAYMLGVSRVSSKI